MRRIPIFASIPGNEHRLARFALQAALLLSVYIIAAQRAEGGIIADFGADMQPNTPATGWSYLWNPTGVQIRDAAHYRELGAVPQPNQIYYDTDGSAPLPRPDPGAYLYFGGDGTTGDGHPGRGSSQSADGLEHYAIAAFTVAVDGQFSIVDSVVTTTNSSVYGIHLRIFVDDHDTGVNVDTGSGNHSVSFDTNLGYLHDGDTIYVAVGAGASDFDDSFNLGYQISLSSVPEPSSVVLILLGGLASLCYSRPRRR